MFGFTDEDMSRLAKKLADELQARMIEVMDMYFQRTSAAEPDALKTLLDSFPRVSQSELDKKGQLRITED